MLVSDSWTLLLVRVCSSRPFTIHLDVLELDSFFLLPTQPNQVQLGTHDAKFNVRSHSRIVMTHAMVVCSLRVLPDQPPVEGVQLGIQLPDHGHVAQQSGVFCAHNVRLHSASPLDVCAKCRLKLCIRWEEGKPWRMSGLLPTSATRAFFPVEI